MNIASGIPPALPLLTDLKDGDASSSNTPGRIGNERPNLRAARLELKAVRCPEDRLGGEDHVILYTAPQRNLARPCPRCLASIVTCREWRVPERLRSSCLSLDRFRIRALQIPPSGSASRHVSAAAHPHRNFKPRQKPSKGKADCWVDAAYGSRCASNFDFDRVWRFGEKFAAWELGSLA